MAIDKKKGLILSFITMFFWALHDVSFRFAAVEYKVEPTVFICFTLFVAAFVLIVVAGPGTGGMATLKRGHTWAYGIFEVLLNIAQMFALIYITTTEMNFLNRTTVIMSLIATWMFFGRKLHLSDIIGGSLVLGGLYYIAEGLDPAIRIQALVCIFFVAFTSVATAMLGEIHPENNGAETVRARSRVAGYVLLVSSFVFLAVTLGVAFLKANAGAVALDFPIISGLPELADFAYKPTFIIALVLGLTVMPIAMYFFFYATKTAKTETFMAVSSTLPFFTYAVEWLAAKFGFLDISGITSRDLIAGAVIVMGAFLIEYMRHQNIKRKAKAVKKESSNDDYDMVNTALRFCDHNLTVVATRLGVPVKDIEKVVEGEGHVSFDVSATKYRTILRNYHRNIATVDPLTGLPNRDALTGAVEGALANKEAFSLVFIDLNKFKPINDTYGHEAGDTILKEVSNRLKNDLSSNAVVSRIGGDEFVIMLRDVNRNESEALMVEILAIIEEDVYLESEKIDISVGASLGLAVAYEDGDTMDALLKKADKEMYENKEPSER
ncbi:MAG: diguanylate cyclase (GGDEF)-like protein [Alphaproteobacteria bacterium]|jgi:diguanylate cyclase (GGDEF)-like protein